MGFIDEPHLPLQSQTCRVFEELYEEHGDTLALQYAGSQLVHSIKTYKKTAAFQERSRDVIQTLSRYYSNTFGDYDKQNAINLFLGMYRPTGRLPPLWELTTDVYLHNAAGKSKADYCAWMDSSDSEEGDENESGVERERNASRASLSGSMPTIAELSDYAAYYRTYELTSFDAMLKEQREQKSISVDSLMHETLSGGPQSFKLWPNKAPGAGVPQEAKKPSPDPHQSDKNKKEAGHWSSSDDDAEDRSDFEVIYSAEFPRKDGANDSKTLRQDRSRAGQGLSLGLRPMKQVYGWEPKQPSKSDMLKYAAYARLGGLKLTDQDWEWMRRKRLSDLHVDHVDFNKIKPMSLFTTDSVFGVEPPSVPERSMKMYRDAVTCARKGPRLPPKKDADSYAAYAAAH
uniref:Uncharacterized protein n=1 Tax=Plectus sambesii TaxID=2011161 RepID=A0A914WV29_9BILA